MISYTVGITMAYIYFPNDTRHSIYIQAIVTQYHQQLVQMSLCDMLPNMNSLPMFPCTVLWFTVRKMGEHHEVTVVHITITGGAAHDYDEFRSNFRNWLGQKMFY